MGVNSVNDAGSAYGAAFRNKPVYLGTDSGSTVKATSTLRPYFISLSIRQYLK